MRFRDSFWAAIGRDASDSRELALERVRNAMSILVESLAGESHHRLDAKINGANDIDELWHMRPELMHAIAESQGEEAALAKVAKITQQFGSHHLGGRSSR